MNENKEKSASQYKTLKRITKDKVLEEVFKELWEDYHKDEENFGVIDIKKHLEKAIELTEKLTREDILSPSNPDEEKRRYDQIQQVRQDERSKFFTPKELEPFIMELMNRYATHAGNKGDSWKNCDIDFLRDKLEEEIREWQQDKNTTGEAYELIDLSIVAFMLWTRKAILKKISGTEKEV